MIPFSSFAPTLSLSPGRQHHHHSLQFITEEAYLRDVLSYRHAHTQGIMVLIICILA